MEKKQYEVLSPVEHDKKFYGIGAPIELTEKEAEPLLGVKAIGHPKAGEVPPLLVDGSASEGGALSSQVLLARQLDVALAGLADSEAHRTELGAKLEASEAALQQARDDIQSLQTAKADAASALAQLQAQHTEAVEAKGQLAGEVADLQAKLAAATAASAKPTKK
ncbi:hypothetical protein PEC18_12120 [Paucibacter sp. O1-1]|nr:hypothetical protein [Paucibacter sp. O1-1]MDA3826562.1 hypothetical protein [Paucibacter sp. O1-1]